MAAPACGPSGHGRHHNSPSLDTACDIELPSQLWSHRTRPLGIGGTRAGQSLQLAVGPGSEAPAPSMPLPRRGAVSCAAGREGDAPAHNSLLAEALDSACLSQHQSPNRTAGQHSGNSAKRRIRAPTGRDPPSGKASETQGSAPSWHLPRGDPRLQRWPGQEGLWCARTHRPRVPPSRTPGLTPGVARGDRLPAPVLFLRHSDSVCVHSRHLGGHSAPLKRIYISPYRCRVTELLQELVT